MPTLSRLLILNALKKHETLTVDDLALEKNLGMVPDKAHLHQLLQELEQNDFVQKLNGVEPDTYTISDKGLKEVNRTGAV